MSFTVELRASVERKSHKYRSLRGVELPFNIIEERRQEFPLLRGVDRYTVTDFSWMQMRDLWMEIAELAQTFEGDTRDTLESLIDMAQEDPHTYLVFKGD